MGKISGFAFDGSGRLDRIDTFVTKAGKEIVTDLAVPVAPTQVAGHLDNVAARNFQPRT
jgi:hypothetical protein